MCLFYFFVESDVSTDSMTRFRASTSCNKVHPGKADRGEFY